MSEKNVFKQCQRVTSKVEKGKVTRQVWELEARDKFLQILASKVTCTLQLDNMALCFSLREHLHTFTLVNGMQVEGVYLSLFLRGQPQPLSISSGEFSRAFEVRVDLLDENLIIYKNSVPDTMIVLDNKLSELVLKENLFRIPDMDTIKGGTGEMMGVPSFQHSSPRLGIAVTELIATSKISNIPGKELLHRLNSFVTMATDEAVSANPDNLVGIGKPFLYCKVANCNKSYDNKSSLKNHIKTIHFPKGEAVNQKQTTD